MVIALNSHRTPTGFLVLIHHHSLPIASEDLQELFRTVSAIKYVNFKALNTPQYCLNWWDCLLGYVKGICGLGPSPNLRRIGGTVTTMIGPMDPMTSE